MINTAQLSTALAVVCWSASFPLDFPRLLSPSFSSSSPPFNPRVGGWLPSGAHNSGPGAALHPLEFSRLLEAEERDPVVDFIKWEGTVGGLPKPSPLFLLHT